MATITTLVEGTKAAFPFMGSDRFFVISKELDFDALGVDSGDEVQFAFIPDGSVIIGAAVEVITTSDADTSATLTIKAGTEDVATGIDLKTAGRSATSAAVYPTGEVSLSAVPAYSSTASFSSKGKVRISVLLANVS